MVDHLFTWPRPTGTDGLLNFYWAKERMSTLQTRYTFPVSSRERELTQDSIPFQAGWTALHLAARAGHLAMVQLLLDSGAMPKSFNDNGRIPLWYAASEGHTNVLALLLKREHDAYSLMEDRKVKFISIQ